MKRLVALAFAVALVGASGGCTSSDDFIDNRVMDCESSEIMIRVGIQGPGVSMELIEDRLKMLVEVSNNSRNDIVVKWVRVDQLMTESAPFRFDNSYRAFDQTVAEGEDHLFELPTQGRGAGNVNQGLIRGEAQLMVGVSVGLASGDQYRCQFAVPAPL